jgi:DNA polymerase III alpha subunit
MTRAIHGDIRRRVDSHGRVWFSAADATELLLRGFDIAALHIDVTPEVEFYNQWCDKMDKAAHAVHALPLKLNELSDEDRLGTWWLTEPYAGLPVREAMLQRCGSDVERQRVNSEMDLFEARGLIPVLRLMAMLVAHFRQHGVVWGVGRGSSVASFVLYLIGVHKINSARYNLDISEFLR